MTIYRRWSKTIPWLLMNVKGKWKQMVRQLFNKSNALFTRVCFLYRLLLQGVTFQDPPYHSLSHASTSQSHQSPTHMVVTLKHTLCTHENSLCSWIRHVLQHFPSSIILVHTPFGLIYAYDIVSFQFCLILSLEYSWLWTRGVDTPIEAMKQVLFV